jgi:hypothetical protein
LVARGLARHHVVLPAAEAEQQIAGLVLLGVAAHHLHDAAAANHFVDRDRRQIARGVVHPGADRRVDREVAHTRQRLARPRLGQVLLLEADGARVHHPRRTFCQDHASVSIGHRVSSPFIE